MDVDLKIPYLENNRFLHNIYFILILMENIDIKKTLFILDYAPGHRQYSSLRMKILNRVNYLYLPSYTP